MKKYKINSSYSNNKINVNNILERSLKKYLIEFDK